MIKLLAREELRRDGLAVRMRWSTDSNLTRNKKIRIYKLNFYSM